MRLLSLDYDPVYGDDTTRANFAGDESVFDYDVVIWDPASSFETYQSAYQGHYQNLPSLSENRSVQIRSDARRRRAEFVEFINTGRVLVVIVSPPQKCYVDTGQRSYSGTGRNQKVTRHVEEFDLLSALPLPKETAFVPASGTRIELDGDGPLVRLLRKYGKLVHYSAVLKSAPGTQLAHVASTDRQVAAVQRSKGGGYLVLLPPVDLTRDPADDTEDEDGWAEDAPEFQDDLLAAIEQLAGGKVTARPPWAAQFATDKQQRLQESVLTQQTKIESSRERLAKLQQELEAAASRDQLFLGTGRALELEVRNVLELLGGTVTEPDPGRDDWKVAFPEAKAVVEVKGVSKSGAEKHAAQLEKWVSSEFEQTSEAPKGILVVNTWRETPLDERTKEDFPDQMLGYSKSRKHCLVTGLQMFVLREEVENNPERAAFWRKKLLQTSGIMTGAKDWRKIIKKTESAD
jgi:hypothetical protein